MKRGTFFLGALMALAMSLVVAFALACSSSFRADKPKAPPAAQWQPAPGVPAGVGDRQGGPSKKEQ